MPLKSTTVVIAALTAAAVSAQAPSVRPIPYADARRLFDVLREELLPEQLRSKTPDQREASWTSWVNARDTDIRARLTQGDEILLDRIEMEVP